MRKREKKLHLNRETLRRMDGSELRTVVGGNSVNPCFTIGSCATCLGCPDPTDASCDSMCDSVCICKE